MNLVSFHVRGQLMGCAIDRVKETIVLGTLTRVFLAPAWVAGLINLRGDVVAVLDLAAFLGLGAAARQPDARIVIVRSGDTIAGLLVDRLADVRVLDAEKIEPPPATLAPELSALLAGVATLAGGAPLAVLDLDKLFDSERLRPLGRRT